MPQHKISTRFYNDRLVRAAWDTEQERWFFSVLDVVGAINAEDDYTKTRNYWKYLKGKLRKENPELVSATNQLKLVAPDGKRRLTDTLDAEGDVGMVGRELPFLLGVRVGKITRLITSVGRLAPLICLSWARLKVIVAL